MKDSQGSLEKWSWADINGSRLSVDISINNNLLLKDININGNSSPTDINGSRLLIDINDNHSRQIAI